MAEVSFVITSCGRMDLLERTMNSFLNHNTCPIAKYILVEDSADPETRRLIEQRYGGLFDEMIFNERRMGQIESVDAAYARVDTPYIFHCEDDWFFYRRGFIEDSLAVLAHDPSILTVWLRELWDASRHNMERTIQVTGGGVMFRQVLPKQKKDCTWYGFTFNPGLRRLADYHLVGPFAAVGHELEIDSEYHQRGFYSAILEEGATESIGQGRHVPDIGESAGPSGLSLKEKLRRWRRSG